MGSDFFTSYETRRYDNYTRAIFGGFGTDGGNVSVLQEGIQDGDGALTTRPFTDLLDSNPLTLANNGTNAVYDFGALRAAMYAYNSSRDPYISRDTGGSLFSQLFGGSQESMQGAMGLQGDDYDDINDNDPTARILGRGAEGGVYYVRGPYWWAFKRSNILPNGGDGFGAKRLTTMDYRDPSAGITRGRAQDKRIKMPEDENGDITLTELLKQLTTNTVTFGTNNVELTQIFGDEGMARVDALYTKLTGFTDLTAALDETTLVPWSGDAPTLDAYVDVELTKVLTDPAATYTPADLALSTTTPPSAPSPESASASPASVAAMSALTTPSAFSATPVDAGAAPTYGDDFGIFEGPLVKADLASAAVAPVDTNIAVTAPDAVTALTITDEQLTTLEALFAITADPALPTITVGTPTQQTMDAEIAAAVSAFSDTLDLRYAAELASLQASLSSSRMVMTSHYDNASAILTANKAAQLAEFERQLVVEQAKGNLQAGMAHQELLVRVAEVKARVESFFLDRYARITDNELRAGQMIANVYMQAYQLNSDALLRAATATAENAIRAAIAHAENYLQFENTKATTGTQAAISTAENYTRAALTSAQNFLQRATSQYENLVRVLLANADAANKAELTNADTATRASISNAENVVRAAITLCENANRVAMQNADAATRVAMQNAEATTQAAIAHAQNLLSHTTTGMELEARLLIATEENKRQKDNADRELTLRKETTDVENEMKLAQMNFENRFKVATTDNEMAVRISQMIFEAKVKVIMANNARILEELAQRTNIARVVSDVTLAWMSAMTTNASALSNIITTGLQQYVYQSNSQRDFELNAENQRWQVAVQRASMMEALAGVKWKSQIQNLMVMQQTLASLGQATGLSSTPSSFSNLMQGLSIAADAASSVISLGVALA